MIASLHGVVSIKLVQSYILDVGGIGYEIFPTAEEFSQIEEGSPITIFVAENIKEDSYTLYGFADLSARSMYYQLTSVSGVGPKAAMSILSKHSFGQVQEAILQSNITLFSNVSGIGKKTAQRIILELKGKLVSAPDTIEITSDATYQALISLGYSVSQARGAVRDLPVDANLDTRVKLALKELAK